LTRSGIEPPIYHT